MGNFTNTTEVSDSLRLLGQYELGLIRPYLYRGQLTSHRDTVFITVDDDWSLSLPLLMCLEKDYGHLCIFHSKYALCATYNSTKIEFDIGVNRFTSTEFDSICSQIDKTHPSFCYISYALVAICQKQAIIDLAFEA